jgi:hypothetical protein
MSKMKELILDGVQFCVLSYILEWQRTVFKVRVFLINRKLKATGYASKWSLLC